jgi:hypothetical protein
MKSGRKIHKQIDEAIRLYESGHGQYSLSQNPFGSLRRFGVYTAKWLRP